MLTHLSLFTGLAGFEIGMRLTGVDYRTVGYCEIDRYCQEIIKARIRDGELDDAPIFPDIRAFPCDEYQGLVDVITGGFPCADLSFAGQGAGLDGEQSGLWWEMFRVIGDIRPRYVILENVAAIYIRGVDRVLGSLAAIGYDCEWHLVSAEAAGAPHLRQRWWCLATDATGFDVHNVTAPRQGGNIEQGGRHSVSLPHLVARLPTPNSRDWKGAPGSGATDRGGHQSSLPREVERWATPRADDAKNNGSTAAQQARKGPNLNAQVGRLNADWVEWLMGVPIGWTSLDPLPSAEILGWEQEPDIPRTTDSTKNRANRLRALGNAIVPQSLALFLRGV